MPSRSAWSRRAFLATTGASVVTATLAGAPAHGAQSGPGSGTGPGPGAAADDFAALRKRWLDLYLGTGYDPEAEPYAGRLKQLGTDAAALRDAMAPAAGSLFPDVPFDPSTGVTQSYDRLATMAMAHAQPGTGLTGDAALLEAVTTGLQHVHDRVYNPSTTRYGNWWDWQIGATRPLTDTLAVLHGLIPAADRDRYLAAVDHFLPESVFDTYTGTSTGANRVDFCRVHAVRGIVGEAPGKIALASKALSPVFPYVTKGDGLYADGSFIQHTYVAYSGTYGNVLLDGLGRLFSLLDGTSWEVTDPNRRIILDSVENAYAPLMHNGLMMDSVSGRAISRGILKEDTGKILQSDHTRGHQLAAAVAVLARTAGEAERTRWEAAVRGWIERDTALPMLTDKQFGVADLARLHALADDGGESAPEPVGHKLFPAMARSVHRRPGWCAGLSLASERIAYYESGNGENPRGWHTGDGMLYWWGPAETLDQYGDNFWPTVDWQRLPGTTVSTKKLADNAGGGWGEARPDTAWVGGATDGEFAAVGQHLKGLESTLTARQSWFCLADTVVCMGAGITSTDGVPVETVFDNRNLGERGAHALTVDGRRLPGGPDPERTFRHARWAHLEGHGGWVWPGGTRLSTLREDRTGAWSDINTRSVTDTFTRRYVTLWTDHGSDPSGADYVYLLMPGAGARQLAARAADPRWLSVDANTGAQQAVTVRSLGLSAANFWAPGTVGSGTGALTSTAPASVLVRTRGRKATLHLSEPVRSGTPFEVTWARRGTTVVSADDGIEARTGSEGLRLRVTPGREGATLRCEVRLG
ncbi:polysaccharide lyase 8 family protein [Streptomyces iconiensis]|uniref:Polysaccharide lyase 8 family protein n=1 Tax=Streptomyces iconiensis TaxID=1384038 RepID=A0ABT6ZTV2_9ACTN|nr:polysaccharide lyase 8 family protein [Streptomyces iconiensis]MDJ1132497.1 polysaccharide lyase 8 family protein [Streptomyces iconiensis]